MFNCVIGAVPAHFEEKFSRVTVKKGGTVKIDCFAKGDPPMTITWTKESSSLRQKSDRSVCCCIVGDPTHFLLCAI